jgi:hypothetical protein
MPQLKRFAFWFCIQFVQYGLVVANGRAYVLGSYGATAVTDLSIATLNFVMTIKMVENKEHRDRWSMAGYVLGGTLGSLASIYITTRVYGR